MELSLRLKVHNAKLLKIIEVMEQNLETPLNTEGLAATAEISQRQLERLFHSHLNDTPNAYYLKLRLQKARRLLQQSSLSVMEVALAYGFNSAAYFSRAYHTHYGHSPRETRRTAG